jgi:hypothetical protein
MRVSRSAFVHEYGHCMRRGNIAPTWQCSWWLLLEPFYRRAAGRQDQHTNHRLLSLQAPCPCCVAHHPPALRHHSLHAKALPPENIYTPAGQPLSGVSSSAGAASFNSWRGTLAIDQLAVAGHSCGGATAAMAVAEHDAFKCGIALDPWW